jgi:hypothetical protein
MNIKSIFALLSTFLLLSLGACREQTREDMGEAVEEPFEEIDEHTGSEEAVNPDEDDFDPDAPEDDY